MRGLETLKLAYQSYKQSGGKIPEKKYIEFLKGAFIWLGEGIDAPDVGDILINDLTKIKFHNPRLRHLIMRDSGANRLSRLDKALEKLKNDDYEVYRGFLSRVEHFEVNGKFPFRRS